MFFKHAVISFSIFTIFITLTSLTQAQTPAWTQITTTGSVPTTRQSHSAIYDATNNLMTIFGGTPNISNNGLNDVWVLVGANGLGGTNIWAQLSPTGTSPTPRWGHTAVYDSANNQMIVFGGSSTGGNPTGTVSNDVWVLSYANGLGGSPTWTQLSTTGNLPSARAHHTAVYDAINNRMIIYGGYNGGCLNDVWILSNANGLDTTNPTWTQITTIGSTPPARYGHTSVYDVINNRMIIFDGFGSLGVLNNNTWVLSNANGLDTTNPTWTQITTVGSAPDVRYGHTAVYDTTDNLMTIFGGGNSGYFNDAWVLSNANGLGGTPAWSQLSPTGKNSAIARFYSTAIYDVANNRMTLFGGTNNSGPQNDTWVLSNADKVSAPVAGFYGIPTVGNGPLSVSFVDTSAFYPTSWSWDFGDGITTGFTFSSTTIHVYGMVTTPTTYAVQLIATNSFGTSTSIQSNYINVIEPGPSASFTGTPLFGYSPLTVYFSDSSNIYGSNPSWAWDFGDSSTSNIQNPVHIYETVASATTYTVQLIVTTSLGTSTSTQNNYVVVIPSVPVEDWMLYSTVLDIDSPQAYLRRE